MIPVEFRGDLWLQKTRLAGLSCGVVHVILLLAILVELRLVTDRRTDGHIASRGKNERQKRMKRKGKMRDGRGKQERGKEQKRNTRGGKGRGKGIEFVEGMGEKGLPPAVVLRRRERP